MQDFAETFTLNPAHRQTLLALARHSIVQGLETGRPLPVAPEEFDEPLRARRAAFVTLTTGGRLRGCIGHLEAIQPLVRDVADNAFAAAFRDPRFPPLTTGELEDLQIEISVLTPATPLSFGSEAELLALIEPGRDGLIHISRLAPGKERVERVEDVVSEGDRVKVRVLEIDKQNRISLEKLEE